MFLLVVLMQFVLTAWMIVSSIKMQLAFERYKNTDFNDFVASDVSGIKRIALITDVNRAFDMHSILFFGLAIFLPFMGLYVLAFGCAFRAIELLVRLTTYRNNRDCKLFKSANVVI